MDSRFATYEYLVIINFDWVPIEGQYPSVAELSELSWLVVTNGSDSPSSTPLEDVLDQQQVFVVPEIAQVDLSDVPGMEFGLSASAAFAKFEEYLKTNFVTRTKTFCLVTEKLSDFHALRSLYLKHSWTTRPTYWNRIFNLRIEFTRKYGSSARPENTQEMLELLQLPNRSHLTAMDECLIQSSIVKRMTQDGYTFLNPEVLTEKNKPPVTLWEMSPTCIHCFGLSWETRPSDLINFFSGIPLTLDNIIMCLTSASGEPSGTALVQFSSNAEALQALTRTGGILGHTRLQLQFSCRSDFSKTLFRQSTIKQRLFGQAAGGSAARNFAFSSPGSVRGGGLHSLTPTSRWSGALQTSYEPTEQAFLASMANYTQQNMNGLVLESPAPSTLPGLLTSSSNSMLVDLPSSARPPSTASPSSSPSLSSAPISSATTQPKVSKTYRVALAEMCTNYPEGTVVALRGLPYTTSDGQISEFFSSFDVVPSSLILTVNEEGKASGDGFLAFLTPAQAQRAVEALSGRSIGLKCVELSIVN